MRCCSEEPAPCPACVSMRMSIGSPSGLACCSVAANLKLCAGTNVVLSGHGRTLGDDGDRVIDVDETQDIDGRDEPGFVVLERVEGKVIARHKFTSFKNFVNAILEVPLT